MDKFEGSLGSVIITWTDIDKLFNVDDEHFIVGVRELTASGIEMRIESVGSKVPGEVTIYVRSHVKNVAQEIMTRAYGMNLEAKPDFDHVIREVHEDSIEFGPAGNRFKVYGHLDDEDEFKTKVNRALAMQMYVSERYNEAMEKKRNAPKGRSNGI